MIYFVIHRKMFIFEMNWSLPSDDLSRDTKYPDTRSPGAYCKKTVAWEDNAAMPICVIWHRSPHLGLAHYCNL